MTRQTGLLPYGIPPKTLRERWTCPDCGHHTRLAICPNCWQDRQSEVDAQPPKTAPEHTWAGLRRWAHMLGFGGHFLTKARRYSVTFGYLRDQRIIFRRTETTGPEETAGQVPGEETTLIVGLLSFAGTGWHTTADALLANTSAALARERHAAGREEIAHEIGTQLNDPRNKTAPAYAAKQHAGATPTAS